MKRSPYAKYAKALTILLFVLFAGPGTSDGDWIRRPSKMVARYFQRTAPELRVQKQVASRRGKSYASDRVMVRFRPGVSDYYVEALLASYGFPSISRIPGIGVYVVQTATGVSVMETLAMLRRNGDIELAQPDYRARLADIPNDSYFASYQWNLLNRGIVLNISPTIQPQTTAGADIKATPAWDVAKGDPDVVIAVLDTGVDMAHPDLAPKIVFSGYDFVNDDDDATDDHWHGTHVAGIAAADTDNATGIAGVAWNCKILPVKVMDENGDGYYSWITEGIVWAADNGADVINLSLGGEVDDPFLEDACRYAYERGAVIAAAAGNEASAVLYPAAYDAYVLAVAASDYNDTIADFSNYGPAVDVAAPGVYILSTAPQLYVGVGNPPYMFATGTSQATPHVSGMAALIVSAKPDLPPADVMNVIRYTADDINRASHPGRDSYAGYGRINMERALVPYVLR
jgi:thermitase